MLRLFAFVMSAGALVAACSGASSEDSANDQQDIDALRRKHKDAGTTDSGAVDSGAVDSGGGTDDGGDGTPNRVPCTSNFGTGLSGTFGRLDGFVVAVVPPGGGACNADKHHVHLQVSQGGSTYDVAINTDSGFIANKDVPLPSIAWSEGWHTNVSLDYPTDLGLHSSDFTTGNESQFDQDIEGALANANHVSVFATLYSHGGVHLVHREGKGHDGAIVTDPLSPTSHVFVFHFSDQSF
jgi:hypothetical protein